jgi:hypothetical protein
MDQTTLSTLLAVGGMIAGFLIRHYLGAPMSSASGTAASASAPAPAAILASPALHPLLSALTAQFDAAIQQVAVNFANATLAVPASSGTAPAVSPPK